MQYTRGLIVPEILAQHCHRVFAFFTNREFGYQPLDFIKRYLSPTASLAMPIQRHTDIALIANDLTVNDLIADALICNSNDLFIGVKTADCVPILVYDPKSSTIACVHAGWRGTAQEILTKTLHLMKERLDASIGDLLMAIGPSIRVCCYEVGEDVADIVASTTTDRSCLQKRDNRLFLDLQGANLSQAIRFGLASKNIWLSEECTCCNSHRYHSYRCSKAKDSPMRQYAIIGMPRGSISPIATCT